jgi:hypothetical protein
VVDQEEPLLVHAGLAEAGRRIGSARWSQGSTIKTLTPEGLR